jgi:regulator of protease activity HflC (stomatin/prohibitin superfamily)
MSFKKTNLTLVEGGHRAIVFNRFVGIKQTVYNEGTNFIIPFIEWPIIYSIRVKAHNLPSLTSSKGLFDLIWFDWFDLI